MTIFRVYAHDGPPAFGSPPAVPAPAPGVIASYWCELLDQATIDSLGYGASGVIPPGQPDGGYTAPGAIDFAVTQLCIQEVDNQQTVYNTSPYEYTLIAPTGQVISFPTTPIKSASGIWEFCIVQSVPQAKGIWRIDVSVTPGFGGFIAPTTGTWPNHITFVMPHAAPVEGILAVEFEGTEVMCPTVTTQVQLGQCNVDGTRQPSSLLLNFTPALAPGTSYNITWFLATTPPLNVVGTIPPGPSPQVINYPPNFTLYPAVSGTITLPGSPPCSFSSTFEFPVGSSGVTISPCLLPPGPTNTDP